MSKEKTNPEKLTGQKLHEAAVGFLYPGILGSSIYGVYDSLKIKSSSLNCELLLGLALTLFIILMFYVDMVYTNDMEHKKSYNKRQFCCEIVIVLTMFPAIQSAVGNVEFMGLVLFPAAVFLAVMKLFGWLWELASDNENKCAQDIFLLMFILYSVFSVVIISKFISPIFGLWITLGLVVVDFFVYVLFGKQIEACNIQDKSA